MILNMYFFFYKQGKICYYLILVITQDHTKYELNEANRSWKAEKKEFDSPMFSFSSVSAATNNFSIVKKLGEGGFGPVTR